MIVRTALLACPPTRAFELFTQHAGLWWPADRRHTQDPDSTIILSADGRFLERATDGREVALGAVLIFDAPRRLVLNWYPGTGVDAPTRVEICFEPEGEQTRVTIRHEAGDAGPVVFERNAPAYGKSWDLVLAAWCAGM